MRNIFVGPNGIRAGWRLLIFFAIVFVEVFIIGAVLHFAFPHAAAELQKMRGAKTLEPIGGGAAEAFILVVSLIAAWIMSRIERRPFAAYGLPFRSAFKTRFWRGALWGFVSITGVLFVLFLLHGFRIDGFAVSGGAIFTALAEWVAAFVLVGLSEEFAFRGYTLYTLMTGIGFWPAAVLMSLLFACAHLGNAGESPLGIFEVALFGIVFCFVLRRTGNLWWGVGYHASWDWGQTFIYGVHDSGLAPWHSLLRSTTAGPSWLSGGSVGPEASVLTILALLLTAVFVARAYPHTSYPEPLTGEGAQSFVKVEKAPAGA